MLCLCFFFFFQQKTAYEMRISDWSSDVCSSDLLNTCHIREKAAEKVYSDIGRLKRDDGSRPMIAVAGCVAQAEGAEIPRRAPSVDIVVGPQAYHRLPELVAKAKAGKRALDTDMPRSEERRVGKGGVSTGRSRRSPYQ